jgi:hypothetical protein
MAKSVLSDLPFHNEEAAFEYVESQLWPDGPVCPHCGGIDHIGRLEGVRSKPSKKHPEGVEQPGLRKCYSCRSQFTVRKDTIFEDSHLPLRLWLQAIHLLCASKKGISTRQLQRMLGCGMKTAWHLGHRVREMMAVHPKAGPLGGAGKTIEADDMELGRSRHTRKRPRSMNVKVLSLVERGGKQRSVTIDHRGAGLMLRELAHKDKRRVTDLEARNTQLDKYERKRLPPGVFVYALKANMQSVEGPHYACEKCYNNGVISSLNSILVFNGIETLRCITCNSDVKTGHHIPSKPGRAITEYDIFNP